MVKNLNIRLKLNVVKSIMKLKILINYFLVVILSIISVIAQADEIIDLSKKIQDVKVTPFTSYRYDIFQFSIPSNGFINSTKLSELTWKNHISEVGIKLETQPKENQFNVQGQLKYGYILNNSKNQDSDWDNIGEFSRTFSSVKGNIYDFSTAIGFSQLLQNTLFTYYLGMDYTKYQMKDYGLYYTIHRFYNETNQNILGQSHSNSKLVSKYRFNNYVPWIGLSLNHCINDRFSVNPTVKLYFFYLSGEAGWVLRDDLQYNPSFTHKAFGIGVGFDTELLYQYNNNLALHANIGVKKLDMIQGIKKTFYSFNHTSSSELYKLSLFSSSISAGIKYKF